jgi:hypothetical protein
MASITITQVHLMQAKAPNTGQILNLYWNTTSTAEMSIDPTKIVGVSYVWDNLVDVFIPGIIQIYIFGLGSVYSTNSYESIVAYMNPTLT